jgi:hypothetical protein
MVTATLRYKFLTSLLNLKFMASSLSGLDLMLTIIASRELEIRLK